MSDVRGLCLGHLFLYQCKIACYIGDMTVASIMCPPSISASGRVGAALVAMAA